MTTDPAYDDVRKPQVTVSGHCRFCTWHDRFVAHSTAWCPEQFATAWIDNNDSEQLPNGRRRHMTTVRHVSRPVGVGELVLLVDTGDGQDKPFATWGRVHEAGQRIVTFDEAGEIGPDNGWCYAESAAEAVSSGDEPAL